MVKNLATKCRRHERLKFDPRVRKIPWRRKVNHSSILLWRIPWTVGPGVLRTVHWVAESDTTEMTQHKDTHSSQ